MITSRPPERKTLVLHHHGPSTDFLCPIYPRLPVISVLRRSESAAESRSNQLFVRLVTEKDDAPPENLFLHMLAGHQETDGCSIIHYNRTRLPSQN